MAVERLNELLVVEAMLAESQEFPERNDCPSLCRPVWTHTPGCTWRPSAMNAHTGRKYGLFMLFQSGDELKQRSRVIRG